MSAPLSSVGSAPTLLAADVDPRPGGREWTISGGGYTAVVSAVGATLRVLTHEGRDLVVPFDAGRIRPVFRGATVAPWPNRIVDGRYTFAGVDYQAAINEVDRGHALHGLVSWVRWTAAEVTGDRLVLRHDLVPVPEYPFPLILELTCTVDADGFHSTLIAVNVGDTAAPYGCCPHPYLKAGPAPLDTWELTLPAATRLEVDERLAPEGTAPVGSVDADYRAGAVIGDRFIDHAFTDLTAGADGIVRVELRDRAAGTGVTLYWPSDWAPWVQIHTGDRPEPENHRAGLAVEPMTCAPDAFNDPAGPPVIAPGARSVSRWTIAAL